MSKQQSAIVCFGRGFTRNFTILYDVPDPLLHNVSLYLPKWHLNASNGLSEVHKCDRRQTDDRPRHAMEKCVAIGVIAGASRNDSAY